MPGSEEILKNAIQKFDPNGKWSSAEIRLHIREPRPQTPARYSDLILNNGNGSFRLAREYEVGEIVRIIDKSGNSEIRLNGFVTIPDEIRGQYRLQKESNFGYRDFYRTIHGLPATLQEPFVKEVGQAEIELFEGSEVYRIPLELKEPMITSQWELLVSKEEFRIVALRFVRPPGDQSENELIIFEGSYSLNGMNIPRFRHWYLEDSREYLGSDIILGEIQVQ